MFSAEEAHPNGVIALLRFAPTRRQASRVGQMVQQDRMGVIAAGDLSERWLAGQTTGWGNSYRIDPR